MSRRGSSFSAALLAATLLATHVPAEAQVIRCGVPDTTQVVSESLIPFWAWRPRTDSGLGARDLEFLWDPLNDPTSSDDLRTTLNWFGRTLVDSIGRNPLGAPYSDFQLLYEYFRNPAYGLPYTTLVDDTASVHIGAGTETYNPSDRSHADVYLFHPTRSRYGGMYPAEFTSGAEDSSTGHSAEDVKHQNSISVKADTGPARFDLDGTGWTRPDTLQNVGFAHEFRHSLPGTQLGGTTGELLSAAAEAIAGNKTVERSADFPYTWSLFAYSGDPSCDLLRAQDSNYQGRSAFLAYLAFNFRGANTAPTLAGFEDDLLHRWAIQSSANVPSLIALLDDAECPDCATKDYFHPGGVAMNDTLRLWLLLHHWRVANYVNNSSLAEGQYGYPPEFGFAPSNQLSAWQSVGPCGTMDDLIVIPPEIILGVQHLTRDTTLRDSRSSAVQPIPIL